MIIPTILFCLGLMCKPVLDLIEEGKLGRGYWNKDDGWIHKYKWDGDARVGEAFPLSTTLLSFLTDGWHLVNTIMLTLLQLGFTLLITHVWWEVLLCVAGFKVLQGVFQEVLRRIL
jgi:hypothetical protein